MLARGQHAGGFQDGDAAHDIGVKCLDRILHSGRNKRLSRQVNHPVRLDLLKQPVYLAGVGDVGGVQMQLWRRYAG